MSGPPYPVHSVTYVNRVARRIHGWSWQAFPIGMGTGAVFLTLASLHDHPSWVTHLEVFFYFLNMALFLLNIIVMALQFLLYGRQFKRLILDPTKGIFVPLVALSFATILIGTINYGVPNKHIHPNTIYALFWVYVVLSLIICTSMLMLWFNRSHDIKEFTPAYAFLIFPMMLVGVVALNVLKVLENNDPRAVGVLLVGYFFQGIGSFTTFFYLNLYLLRVMTTGFLEGHQANGAFVACGPPGFTALALIKLGDAAREILPEFGLVSPLAGEIWWSASILGAIMLFGLSVFLFVFAVLPYWFKLHKRLEDILGCWAITFPNVGWITTMKLLGDVFQIRILWTLHLVMTALMCTAWAILMSLTITAFWRGKIFMSDDPDVARESHLKVDAGVLVGANRQSSSAFYSHGQYATATGMRLDAVPVHDPNMQNRENTVDLEKGYYDGAVGSVDGYHASQGRDDVERPVPVVRT